MYEDNQIFANCCERVGERNVTPSIKEDFPHLCGKTKKSTNAILRWLKFLPRVQGGNIMSKNPKLDSSIPSSGAGGGTTKSGFLAFYVYLSCGEFSHFKRPSLSSFILFPRSSIWIVFHPSMAAALEIALYGGDSVLQNSILSFDPSH